MSDPIDAIINAVGQRRETGRSERESIQLKKWWVAERMAPTLLQYQSQLLSTVMDQIRELVIFIEESTLALCEGPAGGTEADIKLRLLVVETELERLKFIARGYLRARLAKVDKYAIYWSTLSPEELPLSPQEIVYLERHQNLLSRLYDLSFFNNMPEDLSDLADTSGAVSMVDEPDLNGPVAIRVQKAGLGTVMAGDEEVTLEDGSVYMMRYSAIKDHAVELV